MERCTWRGCKDEGMFPQRDTEGQRFALLCFRHAEELEKGMDTNRGDDMLRVWILCQGGNVGQA